MSRGALYPPKNAFLIIQAFTTSPVDTRCAIIQDTRLLFITSLSPVFPSTRIITPSSPSFYFAIPRLQMEFTTHILGFTVSVLVLP